VLPFVDSFVKETKSFISPLLLLFNILGKKLKSSSSSSKKSVD